VLANLIHDNLQVGVDASSANIKLDAENGADLTDMICADTTTGLNDNQKLSLTYNEEAKVINAVANDFDSLASGKHIVQIIPSETAE
jgi:hypothetical protein